MIRDTGWGIYIDSASNDNTVSENTVTVCTNSGIDVYGSRNLIDWNVTNSSTGFGIKLEASSSNNIYRENAARGNTGAGGPCTVVTTTDFCNSGAGNSSSFDNFMPGAGM